MKLYELNAKIHQSKKHFPFIKNNNVLDPARLRIFSRRILDVMGHCDACYRDHSILLVDIERIPTLLTGLHYLNQSELESSKVTFP